jgi:large subunit ribosomal protein L21
MYAIVDIAGQQFKVEKNQKLYVHRLEGKEGSKVVFDKVLLTDDEGKIKIGTPILQNTIVTAKIVAHLKGDKVQVFKKKRRKGYQVHNGHRQSLTQIEIANIGEGTAPKPAAKAATAKKQPEKAATAEKTAAKKAAPVKAVEKETTAKKPATKTSETKSTDKPAAGAKTTASKSTAKKATASTSAAKSTKKPAAAKSAAAKKPAAKKAAAPKKAAPKKSDKKEE